MGAVAILGGAGFIGSALATRLARDGRMVRVLSRRPRPAALAPGVSYFRGGIEDRATVRRALDGARWAVHLACESVPGARFGAAEELETSVLPTLRFLELLPATADLLFVSTGGAIYGNVNGAASEGTPLAPLSYYAAGKASVEAFIGAHAHQNRRRAVIVRPSNVYGPGQPVRRGFGVVPALLHAAARGERFTVLGGGAMVRDYLYIDDLVELLALLLDRDSAAGVTTLNAGSGRGCSVNRLVGIVERVTGHPVRRLDRPARPGDVRRIVLDTAELKRCTGWAARTPIGEGIRRTWAWYCDDPR